MESEGKFDRPELLSHSFVPLLSQASGELNPSKRSKFCVLSTLSMDEHGPEKAGVGGSIPSLATIFSITYKHSNPEFRSNSFQFQARRTSIME